MYEQLSLFDLFEKNTFPCDDCVFCKHGCCDHIQSEDFYCVLGSFRVRHDQAVCSKCGRQMEVKQYDYGCDSARCRCGLTYIYNNRGNRPTAMELFRKGELYGV